MTDESPAHPATAPAASESAPEAPATPPMPTAPPRKPLRPLTAGLIGLAIGAGLMGGIWAITASSGAGSPGSFTLEGEFALLEDASETGSGCEGTGGYDDIAEGASVTVYGADGDVIATGSLGDSETITFGTCKFGVAVEDVPKGEKFYKVEVSHRGTVQLSAEEAENGEFSASLG
ncbi:hypothetical protein OG613_46475 (plasmid) [Streptomyces sp. NBC_00015]|uniref:hypothetical protein n=2 Tax=unclassified Streptomyces TaxID=2593676 RepID=UPI002F90E369